MYLIFSQKQGFYWNCECKTNWLKLILTKCYLIINFWVISKINWPSITDFHRKQLFRSRTNLLEIACVFLEKLSTSWLLFQPSWLLYFHIRFKIIAICTHQKSQDCRTPTSKCYIFAKRMSPRSPTLLSFCQPNYLPPSFQLKLCTPSSDWKVATHYNKYCGGVRLFNNVFPNTSKWFII